MKIERFEDLECWKEAKETFENIYNQAERVSKLDSGLITYLLNNEKRYKNKK
jgi:hypothetical protein